MPFQKINVQEILTNKRKDAQFNTEYERIDETYQLIEQVIKIRKFKNLTQAELALKSHVSQQAISRLEREKHIPNMNTFLKIVLSLDCHIQLTQNQ